MAKKVFKGKIPELYGEVCSSMGLKDVGFTPWGSHPYRRDVNSCGQNNGLDWNGQITVVGTTKVVTKKVKQTIEDVEKVEKKSKSKKLKKMLSGLISKAKKGKKPPKPKEKIEIEVPSYVVKIAAVMEFHGEKFRVLDFQASGEDAETLISKGFAPEG